MTGPRRIIMSEEERRIYQIAFDNAKAAGKDDAAAEREAQMKVDEYRYPPEPDEPVDAA